MIRKILYSSVAIIALALIHIVMFGVALEALDISSDILGTRLSDFSVFLISNERWPAN